MTDPEFKMMAHAVLVYTLVQHQRVDGANCLCGYDMLGSSFAMHVAGIYQRAMAGVLEGINGE